MLAGLVESYLSSGEVDRDDDALPVSLSVNKHTTIILLQHHPCLYFNISHIIVFIIKLLALFA